MDTSRCSLHWSLINLVVKSPHTIMCIGHSKADEEADPARLKAYTIICTARFNLRWLLSDTKTEQPMISLGEERNDTLKLVALLRKHKQFAGQHSQTMLYGLCQTTQRASWSVELMLQALDWLHEMLLHTDANSSIPSVFPKEDSEMRPSILAIQFVMEQTQVFSLLILRISVVLILIVYLKIFLKLRYNSAGFTTYGSYVICYECGNTCLSFAKP